MQSLEPKQQARFLELRRQLTDLNYGGDFSVPSMNVVEHLLSTLTATTGSYQELQDKETRLSSDLALAQAQLFPLRKDNSRLTRENHQLHVDNIRQTDAASNRFAEQNVTIRKLQDELVEMALVVKMKEEACQRIDAEKERLREAYEELADPSMKGNKGARRMMKTTSALPPKQKKAPAAATASAGDSGAEAAVAEGTMIEALRRQLDEANAALREAGEENGRLSASVSAREMELARSTRASDLEDAGSTKAEQLASADASNRRVIDQLNGQVDFLNEQLALREAQLVESANKVIRAEELQLEFGTKSNQVDSLRGEVSELQSQLRESERKSCELALALETATGGDSADAAEAELGGQTVDRSTRMSSLLYAEQKSDSGDSYPSVLGRSGVPMPEQTRSSGRPAGSSYKRAGGVDANASDLSFSADDTAAMARELADKESKLAGERRRIASAPRTRAVGDTVLTRREHEAVVAQLLAEKAGLLADMKSMNHSMEESLAGDAAAKERLRRGEDRLATAMADLEEAQAQSDALARALREKEAYLAVQEAESAETARKLAETTARLGSASQGASEAAWQANHSQAQLDEACRERDAAQALATELRHEIGSLRRERVDVVAARDEAEGRLRVCERDAASSQAAADKANRQLLQLKSDSVAQATEGERHASDAAAARRKLEHSERMLAQTQENLNSNKAELTEALNSLAMYQMSASPGNVADQLRADLRSLKDRCEVLEGQRDDLQLQLGAANDALRSAEGQRSLDAQVRQQGDEDREALVADIDTKNDLILDLQKAAQRLELEVDRLGTRARASEAQVEALRGDRLDREVQSASALNTSQQLSSDVSMLTRRCVDAEEAYAVARRQAERDQQATVRATERASSAEREVASLGDLLATSQVEMEALSTQLEGARKQLEAANRQLAAERSDVNRAMEREDDAGRKAGDLQTLLASSEKQVRAQALRNRQLLAALQEGEDGAARLESEMAQLKQALAEKTDKTEDLAEVVRNLDASRDVVQAQLDDEQERRARQDQALAALEQKNLQLRQALEGADKRLNGAATEVLQSQQNMKNLDGRLVALRDENTELKRRYGMRNADVAGAAEDLQLMTKENQALTAELADTSAERDRLRGRVAEVVKRMTSLDQSRKALEIERTDLVTTYRGVLAEKRKLENELAALAAVKQRTGVDVQSLHGTIAELKGLVTGHGSTERRWMQERSTLLKQLEALNDELVRARKTSESVEADNRRLMNDTHALRQTNTMLNERVQMVIKRATAAADANKVLSSRLASVERERDAVRALINAERQRAEDYGALANNARAQAASREGELARMMKLGQAGSASVVTAGESVTVASMPSGVSSSGISAGSGGSSASSAAAAREAGMLNASLGLSEEDSELTPPELSSHAHQA